MNDLEKYLQIKKEAEQAEREAARAEGALHQTLQGLRKAYDCKTIEDAEKMLKDLKRKRDEAKTLFDKQMRLFEKKWKGRVEEEED